MLGVITFVLRDAKRPREVALPVPKHFVSVLFFILFLCAWILLFPICTEVFFACFFLSSIACTVAQ